MSSPVDINNIAPFAVTNFRNIPRKFGIKLDDRRRHVYAVGKTGMGKSVLLENMIFSDIRAGYGLAVVDPHGDLVEKILDLIPSHRVNDIVYFNPSDVDHPIAFNPLESVDPKYRHLIASGLVGVFKKIWADSWGPRLEYILRNAILSLLEYPGSTLLGITRILVDKYYRKKVLEKLTDPVVRSFWIDEYDNYNEKFRAEAISPIQNKIGQFLSLAIIRNIVGQSKSTIDLREIMDSGKVLLMDLSKGRIGEDNSALLGAMMITKIQLAAMSRIDTPEEQRRDFFLYVDEFQNFATESFANILSEARKYRLNLIIAHQYIEQLGDVVKAAVFGNVGTMICFRVGAEDGEFLEKEFGPNFMQADLVNLPKYHVYLKLMIDGVTSGAFSATTLPPVGTRTSNREKVTMVSRERYAKDREEVEGKILRWAGVEEAHRGAAGEDSKSFDPEEAMYRKTPASYNRNVPREPEMPRLNLNQSVELFEDACWVCGRKMQLPFKPDGIRPVYCKEDMRNIRAGLIPKPKPRLLIQNLPKAEAPAALPVTPLDQVSAVIQPAIVVPAPTVGMSVAMSAPEPVSQVTVQTQTKILVPQAPVADHASTVKRNLAPVAAIKPQVMVPAPPPAVSLQEAVSRIPVSFNQGKNRAADVAKIAAQPRTDQPMTNDRSAATGPQSLRPGQVANLS